MCLVVLLVRNRLVDLVRFIVVHRRVGSRGLPLKRGAQLRGHYAVRERGLDGVFGKPGGR